MTEWFIDNGPKVNHDLVEVVRCKDCTYSQFDCWVRSTDNNTDPLAIYGCAGRQVREDDFCSKGERIKNATG